MVIEKYQRNVQTRCFHAVNTNSDEETSLDDAKSAQVSEIVLHWAIHNEVRTETRTLIVEKTGGRITQ
jgi:hypothetical protein